MKVSDPDLEISPTTQPTSPTVLRNNSSSSSVQLDDQEWISLDDLVDNRRKYPLDRDTFIEFLKQRHAEENFEFLVAVNNWKKSVPKDTEKAREIIETYISDDSATPLNLSSSCRQDTQARFKMLSSGQTSIEVSLDDLFSNAEDETRSMFAMNRFLKHFSRESMQNIDDSNRRNKFKISAGIFSAYALMAVILCLSCAPKRYRLFTLIPAGVGAFMLCQASWKFCAILGFQGKTMRCNLSWAETFATSEERAFLKDNALQTRYVKKSIMIFGCAALIGGSLASVLLTIPQNCLY
jgi:hypothetical protein